EYWEAAPPETTDWITTGRLQETPWEPPTTGMTSDFTQTRWVRLAQEKRTHQQERNLDTGELRTVSTSVETRAEDIKESRQVKVTSTPETMVRSGYGCTEFLPKADTVAKGTTFDQSRTCYNDYEKHIYYLVNGTVIDSDTRSRTEAYEEWNYN
ncbi:hypothetical protein, partial [Priestia megaterium]|uniref:hypothetical protein n=1 Tax=Priestia megaterium TaxID=1404 RepID=UPI0035B6523F